MKNTYIIWGLVVIALLVGGAWWSNSLSSGDSGGSENPIIARDGLHWHSDLAIVINGEQQDIPANIGLIGGHNPIHTHENDGEVHMEFEGVVRENDTRLGILFNHWGREFTANRIFDYVNGEGGSVRMLVNGVENTDFENYRMHDGDKIEIRYE